MGGFVVSSAERRGIGTPHSPTLRRFRAFRGKLALVGVAFPVPLWYDFLAVVLFTGMQIKRPVLIAVLASVIGVIACPIAFHHAQELNPFHSHLFLTPLSERHSHGFEASHGHTASTSVTGNVQASHDEPVGGPAIVVHDYDSVASAVAIAVSGWLMTGQSALLSTPTAFWVHSLGPDRPSPQGFISLPEKPPPQLA